MNTTKTTIKFNSINFPSNGVLASGILGVTGWSMVTVAHNGAGGVTCKSISLNKRKGHASPIIQVYNSGLINAVGLSSTGIDNSNKELAIVKENSDAIVIASIFGGTPEEFVETVKRLDPSNIDMIEANISCPNVHDEFGMPFSYSQKTAVSVIKPLVQSTNIPILAKLSPNVTNIGKIAKACEDVGAQGITAINTVGPGMLIDIETFQPKLSNKTGGLSGPAILPIAIRCVYDIYKNVSIPIIGMGGITNTDDAIQMILAGATVYGVGSGILYEGKDIFNKINKGIQDYLNRKNLQYQDIIGASHRI